MKKIAFSLLLLSMFLLSACSAEDVMFDPDYDYDPGYENEDPSDDSPVLDDLIPDTEPLNLTNQPAQINRKMIFTAEIGLVTPTPVDAYNIIIGALTTYDAFVEQESYQNNIYTLKLRVLTDNYQDYITYIRTLGHTGHFQTTAEDVTNTYSTLQSRLDALNTQHARILDLLETATNMDDIIELEDKLTDIESELNEIGDRLTNYDSLIEYSTINLVITEIDTFDLLLPKTTLPNINNFETTASSISFEITNFESITKMITASLYLDGLLVETIEVELMANANNIITFDELKPSEEYYLSLYASIDNYQNSELYTRRNLETESTFLSTMWYTLTSSINVLGTVLRFLLLSVIALFPFAVVGVIVFIPIHVYIKRHKKIKVSSPKDISL
jgi:hypothetical protein